MTLVVWVLDSSDLELVQRWTADGSLPNIAALWKNSRTSPVGGPGWFDEIGTWVTAYSGIPQTQHGYYCARQLKPRTYTLEHKRLTDAQARPCWHGLNDPDFRALIWDPIECVPSPNLAGSQLYNVTAHHESYAAEPLVTIPAHHVDTIRRHLGKDPRLRFNRFGKAVDFYGAVLRENLSLLDRKSPILRDLVCDGHYDLIVIGFNEIHDAGHLMWSFMDGKSPDRDPEGTLSDAVHMLYKRIDREIGAVQELLPAGSAVCLLSMYGMQDRYPVLGLMENFMLRLGYQIPCSATARKKNLFGLARHALPESLRYEISKHLPTSAQQNLLFSSFAENTDFSRSRAFALPTSLHTGAIRVNLKGREPTGVISPGREYDALLDELEADFHSLIDPVTGEPAVDRVARTAGHHIEGPSELLPDLFVHLKPARHFLDRVIHPRTEITQRESAFHRDSGHRQAGFAALSGQGIEPAQAGEASILDIAPTLLDLLGLQASPSMPGTSLLRSSSVNRDPHHIHARPPG
jgi:predicted AlkP superfamily phosphohydrolase/phosphomutase